MSIILKKEKKRKAKLGSHEFERERRHSWSLGGRKGQVWCRRLAHKWSSQQNAENLKQSGKAQAETVLMKQRLLRVWHSVYAFLSDYHQLCRSKVNRSDLVTGHSESRTLKCEDQISWSSSKTPFIWNLLQIHASLEWFDIFSLELWGFISLC